MSTPQLDLTQLSWRQPRRNKEAPALPSLPWDVIPIIAGYLDQNALCAASQVNHRWNRACSYQPRWERIVKRLYGSGIDPSSGSRDWKGRLIELRLRQHALALGKVQLIRPRHNRQLTLELDGGLVHAANRCYVQDWPELDAPPHLQPIGLPYVSATTLDHTRVIAGTRNGQISVWDRSAPTRPPQQVEGLGQPIQRIAAAAYRVFFVTGDGALSMWDRETPPRVLYSGESPVRCIAVRNDVVIAGLENGVVHGWYAQYGFTSGWIHQAHTGAVDKVCIDGDYWYSSCCVEGSIHEWRLGGNKRVERHFAGLFANLVTFDVSNRTVFAGFEYGYIGRWLPHEAGNPKLVSKAHQSTICDLQIVDTHLYSSSAEGDVLMWDPSTLTTVRHINTQSRFTNKKFQVQEGVLQVVLNNHQLAYLRPDDIGFPRRPVQELEVETESRCIIL